MQDGELSSSERTKLHLLSARSLFANQENEKAVIEVQKAKDYSNSIQDETEKKDYQSIINVLLRKIELELTNSTKVGNINDAAYLTSSSKNGEEKKA